MGTGKTGTSALQSSFAQNSNALEEQGVIYAPHKSEERAARGLITSGNAAELAQYLSGENGRSPLVQLEKILESISKKGNSLLLSSEGFNTFDKERLKDFKSIIEKYGYSLKCIFYVRSIAGYALSSYSQRVKRHQYSRTFSGYLRLSFNTPFSRIKNAVEAFGRDAVHLYNYDAHKDNLDEHFYRNILTVDVDTIIFNKRKVNRSLNSRELQFLRLMNRAFDNDIESRFVSDSLIYAEPEIEAKPRLANNDFSYLRENFQSSVDYINSLSPDVKIELIDDTIELCERAENVEYNHFQKSVLAVLSNLVKLGLSKK